MPLLGRHGEFALFTVTSKGAAAEWRKLKEDLRRDLVVMSWNFHAAALRSVGVGEGEGFVRLPPREASCLRWKGLGKTDEDIGRILGISPHTVRFHLESSRSRLNAANTMRMFARAISLGLINLSYEPPHLLQRQTEAGSP